MLLIYFRGGVQGRRFGTPGNGHDHDRDDEDCEGKETKAREREREIKTGTRNEKRNKKRRKKGWREKKGGIKEGEKICGAGKSEKLEKGGEEGGRSKKR